MTGWAEQELAAEFDREIIDVLDGRPAWVSSARSAVVRYVGFMDEVEALVGAAEAENWTVCREVLARIDADLSDLVVLLDAIPVPGAPSIRSGVESMQADFRANSLPDMSMLVEIAKWLDSARSIGEASTNTV